MVDLAVGAPYDDAGVGKVYIFHGAAHGVNTKPAQVGGRGLGYVDVD